MAYGSDPAAIFPDSSENRQCIEGGGEAFRDSAEPEQKHSAARRRAWRPAVRAPEGKDTAQRVWTGVLGSVELAFHELAKGTQTIQRMYETNQHVLRLGCCVDDFLPDMLRDFTVKYPDVGLRQFSCPYDDVADKLLDSRRTLSISNRPPENENVRYLELGRQDYVLLMNAKHPLAGRDGIWLDDLRNEKFICDSSLRTSAS